MVANKSQRLTLDQQRAEFAWTKAKMRVAERADYATLTKSAPAFIMANGLMQALAFYQSRKSTPEAQQLTADIAEWIQGRMLPGERPEFESVIAQLYKMSSMRYMEATRETLAMLRWLRQFADALAKENHSASQNR